MSGPPAPDRWADYAWIGLGGNLGEVAVTLAQARKALCGLTEGPLLISPMYRTPAWGMTDQPAFLNQVVGLIPNRDPEAMMQALLDIEQAHGRVRREKWGPRTLDLDLLAQAGTIQATQTLTLPHPGLADRRFVLAPWADLAPDLRPPGYDATVAELLAACPDGGEVKIACE